MNTLTLTVADRILLSALLPQQGTRAQMIAAQAIDELLTFTPEEKERLAITTDEAGGIRYNAEQARFMDIKIDLSAEQVAMLKACADGADQAGQISRDMLPLLTKLDTL